MLNKDNTIELPITQGDEETNEIPPEEETENITTEENEFASHAQIKQMRPSQLKIRKEEIDMLTKEYNELDYDYYNAARPYIKRMIENGVEPLISRPKNSR